MVTSRQFSASLNTALVLSFRLFCVFKKNQIKHLEQCAARAHLDLGLK